MFLLFYYISHKQQTPLTKHTKLRIEQTLPVENEGQTEIKKLSNRLQILPYRLSYLKDLFALKA